MKRIALFLLQFSFLMAMVHAQQVWTEGTQWEVEYNDGTPRTVFELISPVEIGGMKALRTLTLSGCRIPKTERDRIRRELPDCVINF